MNKRGQFYLVGAIVIVSLIIGFVTITNYTKQDSSTKIYDLSEELGIESSQVLEYGLVNQDDKIPDFTEKFGVLNSQVKLVIIIGNEKEIKKVTYNDISGSFSYGDSGKEFKGATSIENIPIVENKVTVIIDGISHTFNLQEGQNFYYVLSEANPDGSVNVATSQK